MSRRLSLDVKPAAPSVAPPIVRRFAASSIGFKGREMKFKGTVYFHEMDLAFDDMYG
jgi:hypothetical protein